MHNVFQIVIDAVQDITNDPDQNVDVGQRVVELVQTVTNDPGQILNAYGVSLPTDI